MATTSLEGSIASQLKNGLQSGSGEGTGQPTNGLSELEDQFKNALTAAGGAPGTVQGQIIGGQVVVNDPSKVAAVQSTNAGASVASATIGRGDSNFLIDGLTKVRGVFNETNGKIATLSAGGDVSQVDRLINMQIQVANYALLVDVSSKIAGKTVQGLDALMR